MNNTTTTTKFNLAHRVAAWWSRQRETRQRQALRRRCPSATVAADQIPAAVRQAWAQQAPGECPGLPVDDLAWLRCSLGLAQFFEACRRQRGQGACALPSKAADSVWHVWLALDPAGLAGWQQRCFGREVAHREAEALGAPPQDCLARTWVGSCRSEGLDLLGPRLPLLFALDGLLQLPAGWAYRFEKGGLVHRQNDAFGRPAGSAIAHAAVAGACLVALGLISAAELAELQRRQAADGGGGADWSSSDTGCDAGSDGGSDAGGCGCGSGCGGD
ncbi:MAG: hypothetical protein GXC94_17710 [Comamonadaceae bacterium]|nr:hypothetical protein [Comamonadaceae bacterium]